MLSFLIADLGVYPMTSSCYEYAYQILAREDYVFAPYSRLTIDIGLILKCPVHEFIHIVIDNTYENLLLVTNGIIKHCPNEPYKLIIRNVTNNTITLNKNNILCHFYSRGNQELFEIEKKDIYLQNKSYESEINNSTITSYNNIIDIKSNIPDVNITNNITTDTHSPADNIPLVHSTDNTVIPVTPTPINPNSVDIKSINTTIGDVILPEKHSTTKETATPVIVDNIVEEKQPVEVEVVTKSDKVEEVQQKRKYVRKKKSPVNA